MNKRIGWTTALAGLTFMACAPDAGAVRADLAYVDESGLEARTDLFIDPTVSWRPQTREALGGSAHAIPVTIEISEGVAVAFLRDESAPGAAHVEGDIVAVFRVLDRVEGATPIRDDQLSGTAGPVYVPGGGTFGGTVDGRHSPGSGNPGKYLGTPGYFVLIDWVDQSNIPPQDDVELWREIHESHPGCA